MNVPFVDFTRSYSAHKGAWLTAVERVLGSGHYILGTEVEDFERAFTTYLGVKHVVGVANGLEALQLSLMALGIGAGDEVITTPFSAVATAIAIRAAGATPVFVDIDASYNIDPHKIEEAITPRTKAILPVHLYGNPAAIEEIMEIAKKHKIPVVEDCAQSHGATVGGKMTGTFGTINAFSFYPTKNLGAFGDGGAVATNNDALADKVRMMRNYGQRDRYVHEVYGINSRLDALQAALLSIKLTTLDQGNARRCALATQYRAALQGIGDLTLPEERAGAKSVYHLFVIATQKRDALMQYLGEHGIGTLIHYPIPIHQQTCFTEYHAQSFPVTEHAAASVLSLPLHPYLTDEECATVATLIKEYYAKV